MSLTAEGVLWSLTVEGGGNMRRGPNEAVCAKNLAVVVGTTPLAFLGGSLNSWINAGFSRFSGVASPIFLISHH